MSEFPSIMPRDPGDELATAPVGTRVPVTIDGVTLIFEITGHDGRETYLKQVTDS